MRMVEVGDKPITKRRATARGCVRVGAKVMRAIERGQVPKGDVLAAARLAGIMAAKRVPGLIPLCHVIPISSIEVEIEPESKDTLLIEARVRAQARTGVEMEALTAVAVAALTIYDMCKALAPGIEIEGIRLVSKSGGKSGTWRRTA